jgi:hypothetical protein
MTGEVAITGVSGTHAKSPIRKDPKALVNGGSHCSSVCLLARIEWNNSGQPETPAWRLRWGQGLCSVLRVTAGTYQLSGEVLNDRFILRFLVSQGPSDMLCPRSVAVPGAIASVAWIWQEPPVGFNTFTRYPSAFGT